MTMKTTIAPKRARSPHEDIRACCARCSAWTACDGCVPGSNNWVIAGRHTASGKPLLSNDMHLSLTVPNIWYMADLRAPGFHAAGVTLPAFPFVIAGHNEHVAWGYHRALCRRAGSLRREARRQGQLPGDRMALETTGRGPRGHPCARRQRCGSRCAIHRARAAAESAVHKRDAAIALKWTLYDPDAQHAAALPDRTCSELGGVSAALEHVVLAHAECRLRRRPGTHCVSRGGPRSAPSRPGYRGRAHSRCSA